MARNNRFTVKYRRKREGKTNYKKRLRILKANKPRLVIRKSLKNIVAQVIEYHPEGDKVIASAISKELEKFGWKLNKSNIPSAYMTGILIGKKLGDKKIKEVIIDIGLNESVKGSKLYAVLKGALDAGLNIPHSKEVLPPEDRLSGKHIANYNNIIKKEEEKRNKRFSSYIKNNINLEEIDKLFEETKNKILKS